LESSFDSTNFASSVRTSKIQTKLDDTPKPKCISQDRLDELILNFVINDMQPFSIVEQPAFIELITNLAPQKKLITRKTIISRLEKMHMNMKTRLLGTLEKVQNVCTTADMWSANNHSYFGMTVHWLDMDTLLRKSAALACTRVTGKHTFDVIAAKIYEIHSQYHITNKVVTTITDNGSNFVKAFRVYAADERADDTTHTSFQTVIQQEDDGGVTFANIGQLLDENAMEINDDFVLPPHQPCAAHTLNLVATHDSKDSENDAAYKKVSRSTMGKCSALWNKAHRSTQVADLIEERFSAAVIVPNATRWNSQFDAMDKLRVILSSEKATDENLQALYAAVGIVAFRPNEMAFISEYCKAMRPLATALDKLQAQDCCYMGNLLPALSSLTKKLKETRKDLKIAVPLVDALLKGLQQRFDGYSSKENLILASITIPAHRLRWLVKTEQPAARALLLAEMVKEEALRKSTASAAQSSGNQVNADVQDDDDDFYVYEETSAVDKSIETELDLYLADSSKNVNSLKSFPRVLTVFLKYNTGLPSSAPVERLFSLGGQILTPRRNRLSDEHFESQLLLRANKNV
jgi:hypothetical protein